MGDSHDGTNGQDLHPKEESYFTKSSAQPVSPASTLPLILDHVAPDDDDVFIITTPKGGCSITYDPPSLLPATTAFSFEMFDMTGHRCHGYEIRPKGDRGPSGDGWTGLYLRVDPIYDAADRKRLEEEGGRGWSMGVQKDPVEGLKEGLVITGSDESAARYALFLITEAMGLSPWHRWSSVRAPWRPNVAWKRHQRVSGTLPPSGRELVMDDLPKEEWARLAGIAEERDAEENLETIVPVVVKLGKDSISSQVLDALHITKHLSKGRVESECRSFGITIT